MKINMCKQLSDEWWDLKVGKISGSRFGQVISSRKNNLVYELMNETLNGYCEQDDYINDDIQYGIDNEPVALELYEKATGIKIKRVGAILSESHDIHMASPDGLSVCETIVQEVKCTQNGAIHIRRVFEGVDSTYEAQCCNYFAVSPQIKEVHFISYCGFRPERPIHIIKLCRDGFETDIKKGLAGIERIKIELNEKLREYSF